MDTEHVLKVVPVITTIVLGAITLWLSIKQYLDGNKNARREEYKFAKLFFEDLTLNPNMHPFARKKGFQAIGKNKDLPPMVIEHLMTFDDPVMALSDYEVSRGYLQHSEDRGEHQLYFPNTLLFSTEQRRHVISIIYLIAAVAFYFLAFAPWLLFTMGKISAQVTVNASVVFFPLGISVTVLSTREFIQLTRARRLIKSQAQRYPLSL